MDSASETVAKEHLSLQGQQKIPSLDPFRVSQEMNQLKSPRNQTEFISAVSPGPCQDHKANGHKGVVVQTPSSPIHSNEVSDPLGVPLTDLVQYDSAPNNDP